jgi:16S rRNA (cytosine1402-N4)-methyltransferase
VKYTHLPVLKREVLQYLRLGESHVFVDATIGLGGHSLAVLEECSGCQVIGIDQDRRALKLAKVKLTDYSNRVELKEGDFSQLEMILGSKKTQGILFDLGVSSFQLASPQRGFSFKREGPLDMRMDQDQVKTAEEVINNYSVDKLSRIIKESGQERWAWRIAEEIARVRRGKTIKKTTQLADIIRSAIPRKYWPKKIDPATKTFQAVRIEVNDELGKLNQGLDQALRVLETGGRIVVISFHSLEDRLVKNKFRHWAKDCICPPDFPVCRCNKEKEVEIITKKPITPTEEEIAQNPRSRSAKLRVA